MLGRLREVYQQRVGKGGLHTLVSNSGLTFVAKVLAAGLSLALHAFLSRNLGELEYGHYAYVLACLGLLELIASLGTQSAAARFVPIYEDDPPRLYAFLRWSNLVCWVGSIVTSLACLSVAHYRPKLAENQALTLALLLLPVFVFFKLYGFQLRALKKTALSEVLLNVLRPLLVLVAYYLVVGLEPTQASTVMAMEASVLTLLAATSWALRNRFLPPKGAGIEPHYEYGTWASTGISLGFLAGAAGVMVYTDTIVLDSYFTKTEVGYYTSILKLNALVNFGVLAVSAIAAPMISQWAEHRPQDLQKLVAAIAAFFFLPTVVIGLVVGGLGETLLGVWGSAFRDYQEVLIVAVVFQVWAAAFGPSGFMLTMTGRQNAALVVLVVAAVANVLLNLAMIPELGILGAAVATGLATILWKLLMYIKVRRELDIDASILGLVRFFPKG